MKINDFKKDNSYSLDKKIIEKLDKFYQSIFNKRKLIKIERVYDILRQKKGIDVILHFQDGSNISIDEKIRRSAYYDFLIEIYSDEKNKKPGWTFKDQCDYIVYFYEPINRILLIPMHLLWLYVMKNADKIKKNYKEIRAENDMYTTFSYAIPLKEFIKDISETIIFHI